MSKKTDRKVAFLWLDLETTGLDPTVHVPLEIAWILTDSELNELYHYRAVLTIPDSVVWSTYCVALHNENGLVAEIEEGTGIHPDSVPFPLEYDFEFRLAGNSPHFDRAFIAKFWPRLDKVLSHRHLDVSVLRDCAKFWLPRQVAHTKRLYVEIDVQHRAQADIERALDLARTFKQELFSDA